MLSLDVIRKLADIPPHTSDQYVTDLRDQLYLIAKTAFERSTTDLNAKEAADEHA